MSVVSSAVVASLLVSLACSAPQGTAGAAAAGAASIAGASGLGVSGAAGAGAAGTGAGGAEVGGSGVGGAEISGSGAGGAGVGGSAIGGTSGGVAGSAGAGGAPTRATLVLTSPAFTSDATCSEQEPSLCGAIPDQNISYEGSPNVSPELRWSDVPTGTKSFAITLLDVTYGQPYWAIWNIPSDQVLLPADLPKDTPTPAIPAGSRQSNATFAEGEGYFGPGAPCNLYQLEIFALAVEDFAPTDEEYVARVRSQLLELGDDVVLGYGRLLGRSDYLQACDGTETE